jgi:hypothetical protein
MKFKTWCAVVVCFASSRHDCSICTFHSIGCKAEISRLA